MKTTADNLPAKQTRDEFARSKYRQAGILAVLAGVVVLSAVKFNTAEPPAKTPKLPGKSVAVAIQEEGKIAQVLVSPGQSVRKGQLLAVMEYDTFANEYRLAQNQLTTALVDAIEGPEPVVLPTEIGALSGGFEQTPVFVGPQLPPVTRLERRSVGVLPSIAGGKTSGNIETPKRAATVNTAKLEAEIKETEGDLPELQQAAEEAKLEAEKYQGLYSTAQVNLEKAKSHREKCASLLAQGVISALEAGKAETAQTQARGAVDQAKNKRDEAQAAYAEKQSALDNAKAKIGQLQAEIVTAKSAPPPTPPAQKPQHLPDLAAGPTPKQQPVYRLVKVKTNAPPPAPLKVDFTPPEVAQDRIEKARHELTKARNNLRRVCIYAPMSGKVAKVAIKKGQSVKKSGSAFVIQS